MFERSPCFYFVFHACCGFQLVFRQAAFIYTGRGKPAAFWIQTAYPLLFLREEMAAGSLAQQQETLQECPYVQGGDAVCWNGLCFCHKRRTLHFPAVSAGVAAFPSDESLDMIMIPANHAVLQFACAPFFKNGGSYVRHFPQ